MYANLGTLLPFALAIALNPASIIAAILLLTSNQGHTKGLAYLSGWLVGLLTLAFGMSILDSSWNPRLNTSAAQFTTWVLFIVGFILLLMAYIQWRQRPPADAEVEPIMWLRVIPQATSLTALSAGLFFGMFNLKNLLLIAVTVLVIGEASIGLDQRIMMVVIFLTLSASGIAAPAIVLATQNERAGEILASWEYKLAIHNVTITCIVLVTIAIQMLLVALYRL